MEKVFTHENSLIVFNIKNVLEDHGIECLIKNEFSSGGAGVLSPLETWPEIWVDNKIQADRAEKIIDDALKEQSTGSEWVCSECGESNSSNFNMCWNCNKQAAT